MMNLRTIIATLIFGALVYMAGKYFLADVIYIQAQKTGSSELSNGAINRNPNEPRYYYGKAKLILDFDKDLALQDLQMAEKLNPKNLVTLRNMVPLYYFLAFENLDLPASVSNIDNKFLPIVIEFYESLSDKYPNDLGVQVLIAKYERKLGLTALYNAKIERIRQLRPDLLEWHPDLMVL